MNARPLDDAQKTRLRAAGQTMDVAFDVAEGGLTPEFYAKLAQHLKQHDLVKLRFVRADRPKRASLIAHVIKHTDCQLVGTEGAISLFHRPAKA